MAKHSYDKKYEEGVFKYFQNIKIPKDLHDPSLVPSTGSEVTNNFKLDGDEEFFNDDIVPGKLLKERDEEVEKI